MGFVGARHALPVQRIELFPFISCAFEPTLKRIELLDEAIFDSEAVQTA